MLVLTAQGKVLETSDETLGELQSSDLPIRADDARRSVDQNGYLLLRGFFPREQVLAAAEDLTGRIRAKTAAKKEGGDSGYMLPGGLFAEVAAESEVFMDLLYGERALGFYEVFFGELVRHYDFTWLRVVPPGGGTPPHMDSVFMNRGSQRVMTAWVPLGDVERRMGGLLILEGSHKVASLREYASRDVDAYCDGEEIAQSAAARMLWNGVLDDDPPRLRDRLGLRWLTTDYRAGDLLTFTLFTAHCSLDNRGDRPRLSSDSRYQPLSEAADPRWIGPKPSAHGAGSKRSVIC
jgi:Phytanoyl-CoA dioxygenase (PhyH)